MSSTLVFLLSFLLVVTSLSLSTHASASPLESCSEQAQPKWIAYRNHSLFTAEHGNSTVLSHVAARVNATSGQVIRRYVLDAAYVITALFTSSHSLFSVASNRNSSSRPMQQDIVVSDIATGRQLRVLQNVSGAVQSADDAGRVLARANYHTVDLLNATTGALLHTIDVDKGSLLPLAVQLHPTNGDVYVLDESWRILELRGNGSLVCATPLGADDQPQWFSVDAAARYAYTLQADTQRPYALRQYELGTGKAGWTSTLSQYPQLLIDAESNLAAGEAGEVWLVEGRSGSLMRFNATGNASLCLDDKGRPAQWPGGRGAGRRHGGRHTSA